jgi:hypothetical protein
MFYYKNFGMRFVIHNPHFTMGKTKSPLKLFIEIVPKIHKSIKEKKSQQVFLPSVRFTITTMPSKTGT